MATTPWIKHIYDSTHMHIWTHTHTHMTHTYNVMRLITGDLMYGHS